MRRPAVLFALAALLVLAHVAARLAGFAEHTSAIVGMPTSAASNLLGPLHVVLHLQLVVVAPILAIAATLDTVLLLQCPRDRRDEA